MIHVSLYEIVNISRVIYNHHYYTSHRNIMLENFEYNLLNYNISGNLNSATN